MTNERNAAEEALRGSWDGVAGALRRHAYVSDLAVLVLDLRFGQAEWLARLLRGDEEVRRKKVGGGERQVLLLSGPRREIAKAVRMVCPDVGRRIRKLRVPAGAALVVVPGEGGVLGHVVERPEDGHDHDNMAEPAAS